MSKHFEQLQESKSNLEKQNTVSDSLEQKRAYYLSKRSFLTFFMTFGLSIALVAFFIHNFYSNLPDWWDALYWIIGLLGILVMTFFLIIVIKNDRKLKINKDIIAEYRRMKKSGEIK